MDRLVRRASSVLGCPLDSVEVVGNGRMMAKLSSLLNNTSHPLQDTLTALGSSFSERLLHPRCVKESARWKKASFLTYSREELAGSENKGTSRDATPHSGGAEEETRGCKARLGGAKLKAELHPSESGRSHCL
ncbi:hypothetical protein L3Q82_007428 [Scortum barcoo]|uniref:Uncharacterized protein n=1 Tax=Scortum barcoo TaxID=214431 RepID=A0ACB8WT15_9TELE|nr:hypothetical protein L3Q82_007428 [Scortum barcoo]